MAHRRSVKDITMTFLRIVLGLAFVFASVDKLADPIAFAGTIGGYKILSGDLALLVAMVLPWIELLAGLGLLFGLFVPGSALLALTMLTIFLLSVLSALWRGLDISCGCFTLDPAAERIGWWKIGENLLLIATSFLILRQSDYAWTLEQMVRRQE